MQEFYGEITKARVHANSERKTLDTKRILRDQIYLHLRTPEKTIMGIVEGAFVGDPRKISEFPSGTGE